MSKMRRRQVRMFSSRKRYLLAPSSYQALHLMSGWECEGFLEYITNRRFLRGRFMAKTGSAQA